jgi:ABC-type dipeptide/oligopeptide/nickel transport system permease subunit
MNKVFLNILIIAILAINFINITITFAQDNTQNINQGVIPVVTKECRWGYTCSIQDFVATIQKAIRALLILGYWIAVIVALIGAFMTMLGGYNKNWLNTGKKMMIDAVTTYIILLLAGVLFDLLLDFLKPVVYIPQ